MSLDLFGAAIIAVLLIGALLKGDHPKPFGKNIILLLVGHMIGLLCDSLFWIWNPALFPNIPIPLAVAVQKVALFFAYGTLVGMTIIYTGCIVSYIGEKVPVRREIIPIVTILCGFSYLIWILSIFNGMFFQFDEQGVLNTTSQYWISQCTIPLLLCGDIFLIVKHHKAIGWRSAVPLLCYLILPLIGFVLSFWLDVVVVYLAATLSMLLMFIVFHLEQDKQLREQERLLTQSRIAIMLTQIQPHFIYNTLTAICGLCEENPKEAQKVTAEFADYLRHNLESLNQSTPTSFEEELRHTQLYLNIEKKRFENKLDIVYDISVTDFRIPALTIQPLVENAVKHGVTKKRGGGAVTISSKEWEDCYEIIIQDNGVGFDPESPFAESDTHIGIENVRERLQSICSGRLIIISEVGIGTTAKVQIPKRRMLQR